MSEILINAVIIAVFVLAMLCFLGFAWLLGSLFNTALRKRHD